jgi:hypothetical protein
MALKKRHLHGINGCSVGIRRGFDPFFWISLKIGH